MNGAQMLRINEKLFMLVNVATDTVPSYILSVSRAINAIYRTKNY